MPSQGAPGSSAAAPAATQESMEVDQSAHDVTAAETGQGQTGAGHALTQALRAPGYPSGDNTTVYKVRHRIPIQLEPEVPDGFFWNNPTGDGTAQGASVNGNQAFLFSGWLAIPVSSLALYMNDKEILKMYRTYQAYRYLSAGVRMSNFQTHSVLPTGQNTPGFALNNSGVSFYSVQISSKEINYPWLLGNQQTPVNHLPLTPDGLRQVPAAFEDGNGTTIAPAYNLRPRNLS